MIVHSEYTMANIPNSEEGDQIPPSPPRPPPSHSSPNPLLLQENTRPPPPPALVFFSSSTTANSTSISAVTSNGIAPEDKSPRSTTSSNPSPRSARSPGRLRWPAGQPSSGRHPVYKGIRIRSGKWVSEIREPRKTNRIWLGTYPTPEMAAAAYDVAALALKGPETTINFPGALVSYALPTSTSASDIRQAAAGAAASRATRMPEEEAKQQQEQQVELQPPEPGPGSGQEEGFVDVDELLDMPNLLVDMAGGMMVSPPRIMSSSPSRSDDSTSHSDPETLWSYK